MNILVSLQIMWSNSTLTDRLFSNDAVIYRGDVAGTPEEDNAATVKNSPCIVSQHSENLDINAHELDYVNFSCPVDLQVTPSLEFSISVTEGTNVWKSGFEYAMEISDSPISSYPHPPFGSSNSFTLTPNPSWSTLYIRYWVKSSDGIVDSEESTCEVQTPQPIMTNIEHLDLFSNWNNYDEIILYAMDGTLVGKNRDYRELPVGIYIIVTYLNDTRRVNRIFISGNE